MQKYWHVINVGVQNTFVYRANFFFRCVFGLVPLIATIYFWRAIYESRAGQPPIQGYTLTGMISYYLLVTIVDALTAVTDDDWQIAADIKDGNINQFLLKPINYFAYRLCLYAAGRFVYTIISFLPLALFIFYHQYYFVPPATGITFCLFLFSTMLSGLLQFFISYSMALLAFWILNVNAFIFILFAFEYIAGGHLFPVDILPAGVVRILDFTPFPYQLFFPVKIYLGKAAGPELWLGLALQGFWVIFFYSLARLIWWRGVKQYGAVGG